MSFENTHTKLPPQAGQDIELATETTCFQVPKPKSGLSPLSEHSICTREQLPERKTVKKSRKYHLGMVAIYCSLSSRFWGVHYVRLGLCRGGAFCCLWTSHPLPPLASGSRSGAKSPASLWGLRPVSPPTWQGRNHESPPNDPRPKIRRHVLSLYNMSVGSCQLA